jgi:hypothetical protein
MSFPEPADKSLVMPHNTVSTMVNCRIWNQVQDAIHYEDCYSNYEYNCVIGCDTSSKVLYRQRIWISNRTGSVAFEHCRFLNSMANLVQTGSLKLAIFNDCDFISTYRNTPPMAG